MCTYFSDFMIFIFFQFFRYISKTKRAFSIPCKEYYFDKILYKIIYIKKFTNWLAEKGHKTDFSWNKHILREGWKNSSKSLIFKNIFSGVYKKTSDRKNHVWSLAGIWDDLHFTCCELGICDPNDFFFQLNQLNSKEQVIEHSNQSLNQWYR
jgi:hypothetical protein